MEPPPNDYGPWTGPKHDVDYALKAMPATLQVLEVGLWHGDEKPAGTGLAVCLAKGPIPRVMQCKVLAAEDPYYSWWLFDSHQAENPGLYRFACGKGSDKEVVYKRNSVTPVWQWRVLNHAGHLPDLTGLKWLETKDRDAAMETLRPLLAPPPALDVGAAEEKGKPALDGTNKDAEVARALDDELNRGGRKRSRGVAHDLSALEQEVRGGDKLRTPRRASEEAGPEGLEGGRPRKERPAEHRPAERPEEHGQAAEDVVKKKSRFETKPREKKSKKKEKKEKAKKGKDSKKKKKKGSSSSSSDSSESSSSASLFRVASSSQSRGTQARLIQWSQENPGKLAASLLQKMQNATGREGEAAEFDSYSHPAAAKAFFLRVQEPKAAQIGPRNLCELRMLATALDHLAQGRSAEAADVLAQRVVALEMSVQDGNWNRAIFLELTQEDRTLAGPELQMLANKEAEGRTRLARPPNPSFPSDGGWQQYPSNWKGYKGDGKSKKKGDPKGKGKGKGKNWGKDWTAAPAGGDGSAAPLR